MKYVSCAIILLILQHATVFADSLKCSRGEFSSPSDIWIIGKASSASESCQNVKVRVLAELKNDLEVQTRVCEDRGGRLLTGHAVHRTRNGICGSSSNYEHSIKLGVSCCISIAQIEFVAENAIYGLK